MADSGFYTVTGQNITLQRSKVINANVGSYFLTGQTAILLKSKVLNPANGTYNIVGETVQIVYTPSSAGYTITASNGVYSVNGNDAIISVTASPVTGEEIFFVEIRSFTERRRF